MTLTEFALARIISHMQAKRRTSTITHSRPDAEKPFAVKKGAQTADRRWRMFLVLMATSTLALGTYALVAPGRPAPAGTTLTLPTGTRPAAVAAPATAITITTVVQATSQSAATSAHGARQGGISPQAVLEARSIARRVGIVAGHKNNDSGTACADGLTEAQVNLSVASRVVSLLRAQGFEVDDPYDEFDKRLSGYKAALLLSIHADSCEYINDEATGYKVAARGTSQTPDEDKRLVDCLTDSYHTVTGLPFHANSITYDMTQYHNFAEIDSHTPAAIIEIGFLYLDREYLIDHQDKVAQGIVEGLLCYLQASAPKTTDK